MNYTLRRATLADAKYIAPRLREADRRECMARVGLKPDVVLPLTVTLEKDVWVCCDLEDTPVVIMGVSPVALHPEMGIVWMTSTDEIFKYKMTLMKGTPEILEMFHDKYPLLANHVDARNTVHIKWLKKMGFSMLREMPEFGVERVPFIEFARLRTD